MMAVTEKIWEDALLLVSSVRSALINRTKHYTKDGHLLKSERDIMECLLHQKEMIVDYSQRISLTTDEKQLEVARHEFKSRKSQHVR